MKRRDFLKLVEVTLIGAGPAQEVLTKGVNASSLPPPTSQDAAIRDYLYRMRHFDENHDSDIYLDSKGFQLLTLSRSRLKRVQRIVGHGNFYLLSFDDALKTARSYSRVGRFSKKELDFLEMIFYEDCTVYGFWGEKPLKSLTTRIPKTQVLKIPYSGNYIYKGYPLMMYRNIRRDIGDQAILTSGVRSVIKQFMLFLDKAYISSGNLSLASRSLAPPGYSYHSIGDFDIGQAGYGVENFTKRFTETEVFRKLKDLGYVKLRYRKDNLSGVRFEPWHIKVHTSL